MRHRKKKLALIAMLTICAGRTVHPKSAEDQINQLVEISAERVVIAEQVGLAKWDSGTPVEDASREDQVIDRVTKAGQSRGLDRTSVSNFFRAQIEANKLVQYSLLAEWRRGGKAPDHAPVDLTGTIRRELDQVDEALIAALEKSTAIRAGSSCRTDVAKAVGKYVSTHEKQFGPLRAIALDRALATACIGSLR